MFRGFSIRGVVGTDLDAEVMTAIGRGVGTFFARRGGVSLVAGYDVRQSSPALHAALVQGILAAGIDVVDVGRVPTPLLNFATDHYQTSGGVMVTASHNPSQYNGLKIRAAYTVHGEDLQEICGLVARADFASGQGAYRQEDPLPAYTQALHARVQLARPLHIAVDGGSGMNGQVVPGLLRALGCQVTEIYCELDGNFAGRTPDPSAHGATADLAALVLRTHADLGLAFDGDGDRVILVDEQGRTALGDQALMLLARQHLQQQPGAKVVGEVMCSQAVADDIAAHGGQPLIAPSGYAFVHNLMLQSGARLGGEMSGHFFLLDDTFKFDDAILAALSCVALVAGQPEPLSALLDGLPHYISSHELRPACPDAHKTQVVEAMGAHYAARYPVERLDGVRVVFGDGWALVRQSNTQPVIALRFETPHSRQRLLEIAQDVLQTLAQEYARRGLTLPLDLTKIGDVL